MCDRDLDCPAGEDEANCHHSPDNKVILYTYISTHTQILIYERDADR